MEKPQKRKQAGPGVYTTPALGQPQIDCFSADFGGLFVWYMLGLSGWPWCRLARAGLGSSRATFCLLCPARSF